MQLTKVERRERALSGIPNPSDPTLSWWKKLFKNPWLYAILGLTALSAFLLWRLYLDESTNMLFQIQQVTQGEEGLTELQVFEAMRHGLVLAAPTAAVYTVFFWIIDRWRPMPWYLKYLALVWGIGISVYISFYVNSWSGEQMAQMASLDDPFATARAAPFSAPFVEETAKGMIVLILAIFARNRIVSGLQAVSLAGLSATGFAFTENIVYYYRQFVLLSIHPSQPDVDAEMANLVKLRGVTTSFAHPTLTAAIGIGVIVMLRTRSKLVRVLAPIIGFGFAALGHMLYNGFVSVFDPQTEGGILRRLYIVFVFVAISLLSYLFRELIRQGRIITYRALDYAQMGWLTPRDTLVFNNLFRRWKLALASLFRGRKTIVATHKIINRVTELCYLRESIDRGLVGRGSHQRERELVDEIRALRGVALDETYGLKIIPRPIFGKIRAAYRRWREDRAFNRALLAKQQARQAHYG